MRAFAALMVMSVAMSSSAQSIPRASIQDQPIGWMKPFDPGGPVKPLKVDHRQYSIAQMSIARQFATWLQASYVPIGGLGDIVLSVQEKLGPYNQNTAALPQSYGAYAKIYTDLKKGPDGKWAPASNSHLIWSITANQFYGSPAEALSTPEQYYFTLPSFAEQGFGAEAEKAVDLSGHPALGRFPAWFQRNSKTGNRKFVLLAPNGKMPFVTITKGKYLAVIEAAIVRAYAAEKNKIVRDNAGNARSIEYFTKYLDEKNAKRLAVLEESKKRYQGRLEEVAEIFTTEPDVMLENYGDVFEGNGGSLKLPVYTIDPELAARCKTDAPQWIVVSWTAQVNDPVIKHLHDGVVAHFNFQYVYDAFFDPAKVKGKPYTPVP